MAFTGINNEDRLVQRTIADYLHDVLGWESIYAWNDETFGPTGTLGRASEREIVLVRELRAAIERLNPNLPASAASAAVEQLTRIDFARSTPQHNQQFYRNIRDGVPVSWKDDRGQTQHASAKVIDFRKPANNRFVAVRELKIQGLRTPHYNRRADLVCFVNGLPLVFFELKAVYVNIRAGFDGNLSDYRDTIPHSLYHNAFLVVSNGDRARYGSITAPWDHFYDWKRNDEKDPGRLDTQMLLDGMLAKDRLLDIVENFILFDASKAGPVRKVIGRNHQVLGVNRAVESVIHQESLKRQYPPEQRLVYRVAEAKLPGRKTGAPVDDEQKSRVVSLVERAHPDLGRLGVFWHTQGSGKSYSMIFFAEKVRRVVPGNFTFVVLTDREDLDSQIYRSFVGSAIADEKTPRATSGVQLESLLKENHRFVFSMIHKFNQDVSPDRPYSRRDDIIVISDEAHRTQSGKLARNMRLALPNAAFLGFTGTPLFKHDQLTKRIFGNYVSKYDFERSRQDGSTVKLVYANRGEKLGVATLDLNDRIATKIEQATLDTDQVAALEKLLGKDYEVITAGDRLDKIADDFVAHCSLRWESGKSMFVCVDKVTCGRMLKRIQPRWRTMAAQVLAEADAKLTEASAAIEATERDRLVDEANRLRSRADWMNQTIISLIISESQNEVKDFNAWSIDIVPHRELMKRGFETPDGRRVDVETAFKDPDHPFRIAVVCAMWLTGFDVECLSTLYIDKPMKAHTLMQAIARANRVYPGKACGVIVDYNGMLRSLRAALGQYATDGTDEDTAGNDPSAPTEELVASVLQAIDETEQLLQVAGFQPVLLKGSKGFARISALRDAVEALYTSEEVKRRFELLAREVFSRCRALAGEQSSYQFAERHDNIEAIHKKLQEKRDSADVTAVLKELHRIVNAAIRAQGAGNDQTEGLTVDLSEVDFAKLREEFAKQVLRKHSAIKDVRDVVEAKLNAMLAANPLRMDFYKRYQEIVADYNSQKDRVTVEETFAKMMALAQSLDDETHRAVREGLSEEELALFDLLRRDDISKVDRERLKLASRDLLAKVNELLGSMKQWTEKEATQAEVRVCILDQLLSTLPMPPYTPDSAEQLAGQVFNHVWQQSVAGMWGASAA